MKEKNSNGGYDPFLAYVKEPSDKDIKRGGHLRKVALAIEKNLFKECRVG